MLFSSWLPLLLKSCFRPHVFFRSQSVVSVFLPVSDVTGNAQPRQPCCALCPCYQSQCLGRAAEERKCRCPSHSAVSLHNGSTDSTAVTTSLCHCYYLRPWDRRRQMMLVHQGTLCVGKSTSMSGKP